MKVYLAGFNVDTEVLGELQEKGGARQDVTPEVISAAYARISRDARPINEIRKEARLEVEKSRRSNSTIIFKMGHHSVAEHAVFNLDIIGASRLAMEELEKFRLCSYTEKSQRYITLEKDFVVPQEIRGTPFEKMFVDMICRQNETYFLLFEKLKEHIFRKHSKLAADPKKHNLLEGWAKEDARYITALATESQVGQTINARVLELLLRRFASSSLAEVRELGVAIYEKISGIAPSIVIFSQANDRDKMSYPQLKEAACAVIKKYSKSKISRKIKPVELLDYTKDADDVILASLLHTSSNLTYADCRKLVKKLSKKEKTNIFKTSWQNMQFYDSMLREYEYVNLTFGVVLSAACFGQLKRHRMTTITTQSYNPALGVTIPESIKEIGMQGKFQEIIDETNDVYEKIAKEIPQACAYILTNAHRRRALLRVNARELYHISRLREDTHAQWDIQNLSKCLTRQAKRVMPLTFSLVGGKDKYPELYQGIFGHPPKVIEATLPGARKIQ
ncbi:MAG: FAD-dependent thymidylate synthase [Candidatus Omnitrophica bacterium]|nr:FAD-dependent thymidylate synthase [Candidatus Omnitrophota bacterium]